MRGILDEISIYSRALTPEELKAIYDAGNAGKCISLGIRPASGGDTSTVTVHLTGVGFAQNATLKLTRVGAADIVARSVKVRADGMTLDAVLDLTGKALGAWNVVATSPTGTSVTLMNGFTIEPGQEVRTNVDLISLNLLRPGREALYWIRFANAGNVDIEEPVGLISWPLTSSLVLSGALAPYLEPVPPPILDSGQQATAFFLPRIPAGESFYFPVKFTARGSVGQQVSVFTSPLTSDFFRLGSVIPPNTIVHSGKDNPPIGSTVFMGPHADNPTDMKESWDSGTELSGYGITGKKAPLN